MRLTSLTLHNIRSYKQADIEFPDGITLLAGDIGAGKSTLLLAIEFALFGLRGRDLPGDALLRHGEQEGSVTLSFQLKNKITIHRALKRARSSVRQDEGYIEIDGNKEALTAKELKARILQLLGYPHALLDAKKSLVYQYTVYTPQEQMKKILQDDASQRLDTLRSVFGVDAYKAVQENTSLLQTALRGQIRFYEGRLQGTEDLKEDQADLQKHKQQIENERQQLAKKSDSLHDQLTEQKKSIKDLEEAHEKFQKQEKEQARLESQLESVTEQLTTLKKQETQELKAPEERKDPSTQLEKLSSLLDQQQHKRQKILLKESELQEQKKQLLSGAKSIAELTTCPVCKQEVADDHKHDVQKEATKSIEQIETKFKRLESLKEKVASNIQKIKDKQATLKEKQKAFQKYQLALRTFEEKQKQQEAIKKQRVQLEDKKQQLTNSLKEQEIKDFDKQAYTKEKQHFDETTNQLQAIKIELAKKREQQKHLTQRLVELQNKQKQHAITKKKLEQARQRLAWVTEMFLQTVQTIEKRVFGSIHAQFSARFTQWFDQLIEDESLFATLDETFTPLVTQDGYDTDTAHLSGGEKTSVALAYRLALSSVLEGFMASLKTHGLLILDEPTDGFSAHQLDRVRDVLHELQADQVLIVSHEQKMESYVDHVIRVHKREHESFVA